MLLFGLKAAYEMKTSQSSVMLCFFMETLIGDSSVITYKTINLKSML